MKKGKFAKRGHRGAANKTLALILSMVLIIGCVAGGTLAWLLDDTDAVVNTFTDSDIEVYLTETDTDPDTAGEQHNYKMIPGCTIDKDPQTWVKEESVDCYLFVKIEKQNNFDNFMTFEIADGWESLTGQDGVYYRLCDAADKKGDDAKYGILKDDQVQVKGEVTKQMMDALTANNYPKLVFTAYASQKMKNNTEPFTAAEAWANLNP